MALEKPMVAAQEIAERYAIYNGDCLDVLRGIGDERVHLSIYSPPFAADRGCLYSYSSSDRDFSNCDSYEQFFQQYDFLLKELTRVTMPGRITAVHCMDVPSGNTGRDHLRDFSGDLIRAHERHGWLYMARYCIWKDPFEVYIRTLAKNLRHRSMIDDSTKCTCAGSDYLMVFRRPGTNPAPVTHEHGLLRYAGARQVPPELLKYRAWKGKQTGNKFSQWIWRNYASAFWDDVRLDRVLPYRDCKDPEDERHVHPLQLDVIERAVVLWSNPGETVFTPFMGVGSEVYGAVMNGRRGVGVELKAAYYRQAKKNLEEAAKTDWTEDVQPSQVELFPRKEDACMDGEAEE